jgi:glycosyltransferase involved in cell wall biosynthesis
MIDSKTSKTENNVLTKVALIHDFFWQNAGAELVVDKLAGMYPNAIIYSSIFISNKFKTTPNLYKVFQEGRIRTTWLQGLFEFKDGFLLKYFKHLFWLYPIVMSFVVVRDADLVIISSTNCGKNIKIEGQPKLLHYCHTPTRYLYNLSDTESQLSLKFPLGLLYKILIPFLRFLDQRANSYLTTKNCQWIANSVFVQGLTKSVYGQDSIVIYPPVDIDKFSTITNVPQDYYLCHGRISFHKRLDLAIGACLSLNLNLKISGSSALESDAVALKNQVRNYKQNNPNCTSNIEFLGRTSDEELVDLLKGAKAFLFPGKEDFGISPIEMMAGGLPVIAFGEGGAVEYIKEGVNGVLFYEQSSESLSEAIQKSQQVVWDSEVIKETIKSFDTGYFCNSIMEIAS